MSQVLLLNASYEPLKVVNWQKAITLLFQGKVEVVEEYNEHQIRTISFSIRLPSVLRLLRYVSFKKTKKEIRFCRANIYLRDNYSCQYCDIRFPTEELTFDHVIPVAQGGQKSWKNIVTCCIYCNRKKGGRTPKQAKMHLYKEPITPTWLPAITFHISFKDAPQTWKDYLYWNLELET